MDTTYLLDTYVTTKPGEPYRLFKFGRIIKNGVERLITPELARQFKLPHFRPPIKRGSHEETTPADGHIVGLEVREDGLYAIPEWTEKGIQDITDGSYRYHSPEVIWSDGGLEDPQTGEIIAGPLIVGDALLHTPHLGEAAALYTVEPIERNENMEDTVQVPKSVFERFSAWLDKRTAEPEPPAPPPAPTVPDEFKAQLDAASQERDEYRAKLEALEAERVKAEQLTAIRKEFDTQEFGMSYVELGKTEEAAAMLSGMTEEQRAWVMRNFKAMSKRIDEGALFGERGTSGGGASDPKEALNQQIEAYAAEHKVSYPDALRALAAEKPELFKAGR